MQLPRRTCLHLIAGAAALATVAASLALTTPQAWSQAARTIKLIIPFPPGGGIDVLGRILAEQIGRTQGPAVVIENRPGAGTLIGADAVVRAKPDGNTVLLVNNSVVVTPHLRKADFDPLSDLQPICNLASTPTVIVVKSSSPYRTLKDLLSAAREKPGELTYGSAPSSVLNVGFEMFAHPANIKLTFVPFPGTAPAVSAVLGGHIDAAHVDYPAAVAQIQAGTLRALATASRRRIEALSEVPTVAESGFPGFELELWYGLFVPAKTPTDATGQIAQWFTSAVKAPDVRSKLAVQSISPLGICGAEFATYVREQSDSYGRAIREAGIKAE